MMKLKGVAISVMSVAVSAEDFDRMFFSNFTTPVPLLDDFHRQFKSWN